MGLLENQLNNPFMTIIQYAEMKVVRGGTVMEGLQELKKMMDDSPVDNIVAERRIAMAIDYVEENVGANLITDKDETIQRAIVLSLKVNLKE